jgi:heat shock protein HtpX
MFNWVKTSILMAGIVALFGAVGMLLGGAQGMLIALLIGAGMNVFAYWNSDKMVLRMYNAQEVDAQSGGRYYAIVRELAANAGLPMPRVYIINQAQPNAFATGRNPEHAAVAATTGITMSATVAGAISMLANFAMLFGGRGEDRPHPFVALAVMIIAPVAAMLIQMAISRSREFGADAGGAEISRDPQALASALRKIEAYAKGLPMPVAEAHPETAQMMIINPLSGDGIKSLFSTHPSTDERVSKLMALARGA